MNLHPSSFTDEEFHAIGVNGCGAQGGWFNAPDYCFGNACNNHDAAYWVGGNKRDRKDADLDFLKAMLATAKQQPWYYRIHLECVARRYYWAVRVFGKKHFKRANRRTRADLDMAVVEYRRLQRDENG